jgi:hypothetical protein
MNACALPSDQSSTSPTELTQGWTSADRAASYRLDQGLHERLGRAIAEVILPEMVRAALLLPSLTTAAVDRRGGPVPEGWAWQWTPIG